ncbi:hypothetical protein NMK71_01645 [Weeksellaceae bacterium KMM 9713]|uniref:Uncharacterized protein n=1 Tax=Profundicola chukchiensis TaxID=2961959 RepID=A0A9X4RUU0_9FLAO|nr:hypothetical protein [Profundicola chukchiensis]MDG4945105.1 hypothetical protein [Profundicola chukchiensis]
MNKVYLIIILLLISASGYIGFQLTESNEENQHLSTEIRNLENDIEDLESEIEELRTELDSKEKEVLSLNESLSEVQHFDKSVYSSRSSSRVSYTGATIRTNINGTFNGWEGDSVFKMMDGSVWQQAEYDYHYHYAYMPNVLIYSKNGSTYMSVEGVDKEIRVNKIY